LAAHEYAATEDFDKAITEYRHAIRIDQSHYNAWYGLGSVFFRQEKYQMAVYHLQRAISINPRSSILHCYLGMVRVQPS
jgi:anaphase-promoting complex subunit 3